MKARGFVSLVLLVMILLLCACSNGKNNETVNGDVPEKSSVSLNDAIKAFEAEGIVIDKTEKPLYEMIGAKDGVIFYIDGSPVKIYAFESTDKLAEMKKDKDIINTMESKGILVLETEQDKAKEIFKNLK